MANSNFKKSNCAYAAEPLISYLYGEIGAAEKVEFESHLKSCAACNTELAEFGFARSAIHEWRGLEFDQIATPSFELPTDSVKVQPAAASRFADWGRIFSFNSALAMAAAAILIAFVGLPFFVFDSKDGSQLAEKPAVNETVKVIASPTVEKPVEQTKITNVDGDGNSLSENSLSNATPVKIAGKKTGRRNNQPVKTSANALESNVVEVVPSRIADTNKTNQKPNAASKAKVPRLIDAEEEEDDSVRLADLFDEIETR